MVDAVTIERIKTLHPKIRKRVLDAYTYVNERLLGKGIRLRFAYTYRTPAEQNALFEKKPRVTNAKAWQSVHNYGLAFDIVLLYDLNGDGTFETASYDMLKDFDRDGEADFMEVVNYFKSQNISWGGDWNSFKDNPHFEINFGLVWQEMKIRYVHKEYTTEKINGVDYIYINI